jgi:H+-transporting ATPase
MTTNALQTAARSERLSGLSTLEAQERLARIGPNFVPEQKVHTLLVLARKFWAPVPWMLEATVALELVLGKFLEAAVIVALLIFNALLSFFQETRAQEALDLLRQRLAVEARALRDGQWRMIPSRELVPGDVVHLQMGDLVPADITLFDGNLLLDQSALTGESMPVETTPGEIVYAGSLVKRGAATGEVTATGIRTFFGKTVDLVRTAQTASHLQSIIFTIVKYLVAMDAVLAAAVMVYASLAALPMSDALPFVLILLVASVPVALPATFTLATALGAVELAGHGVLVTRLSAIEEAAAMDVLCSDKTGTITKNELSLEALLAYPPFTEHDLLQFAAYASDAASQDPIDMAVFQRLKADGVSLTSAQRLEFIPFEPMTRIAEAVVTRAGETIRAIKGAPRAVAERVNAGGEMDADFDRMAASGYRVLAVAGGPEDNLRVIGLLGLQDPPREDSAAIVKKLNEAGVRVVMVTGDGAATARAVARQVGIAGSACTVEDLHTNILKALECAVFAGVFPEDKFRLVRALQEAGHIVGMTGDGVNDAPALKQAEVGIAVANATDAAKASASLVLTNRGLADVLCAVETSRRIYQRMLTYTLNKIIKTVEIALFLSLGVLFTRSFIITPLLIVLLLFTNDFVTMSIATDRVSVSSGPDRWRIGSLMWSGLSLGSLLLLFSFGLFFFARNILGMNLPQLQTLVFATLVFTGQGMVYLIRERRPLWHSMPSPWMIASSVVDVLVVSFMAIRGILMAPLPGPVLLMVVVACLIYLAFLDFIKVPLLQQTL